MATTTRRVSRERVPSVTELEAKLARRGADAVFGDHELEGLAAPVRRYLGAAIAPGTPLAASARLTMRGSIKLGGMWLPFRAHQVLAPHAGAVWSARVGGILSGSDSYVDGRGAMSWQLFGALPVIRAAGPDISRSAAGRFGAEAVWVPTTLLPRFGVAWTAQGDHEVTVSFTINETYLALRLSLEDEGRIRSLEFDRWGDAENSGRAAVYPFGLDVTDYGTFGGLTIPRAGQAGWFHGTDRWDGGGFRYEITSLELLT